MSTLYCMKCGHEFPTEGAKLKPDITGFYIFTTIGVLLLIFAILAFAVALPTAWNTEKRTTIIYGGGISLLAGLGAIGIGRSLKKGVYHACPQCGANSMASDSKSAIYQKEQKAKKGK